VIRAASTFRIVALEGHRISRAIAGQRMLRKLARSLTEDIAPLLPAGVHFTEAHAIDAFDLLADCRTN